MYKKLSTLQDKLKINRHDFIGKVTADIVEFINGLHVLKIYNMAEKRFSKTAEAVKNLRDFPSVRNSLIFLLALFFSFVYGFLAEKNSAFRLPIS